MENLFLLLSLTSIIALVIGLIKPSLLKIKNRKKVASFFGTAIIVFFILFGITNDNKQNVTTDTTNEINQTQKQSNEANETNITGAFKLASLEIGHNNPPQSLVDNFDNVLNQLSIKCSNEEKGKIANYIFIGQEKIESNLGPITLLEVANGINNSVPESINLPNCAEISAMFVALMITN